MKLTKPIILMLFIALLTGGAAAYLSDQYIAGQVNAYQQNIDAQYEPIKVIVATRNLLPGTAITTDTVSIRKVPRRFVHREAVRPDDFDSLAGLTLSSPVDAGESILRSHLSNQRGGRFAGLIVGGKRALTVPVDEISSVSGMLQPNDHVDVLMTTRDGKESLTFPLLTDVLVLATGIKTDVYGEDGALAYNTATVLVDPKASAMLVHAREVGKLTFVLRGNDAIQLADFPSKVTHESLLGEGEKEQARKIEIIVGGR